MSGYFFPQPTLDVSVVVPFYNEADNVAPLAADLIRELDKLGKSYEAVFVNDGSTDGTAAALDAVAQREPRIRVLHFAGNRGQTIAIAAGMHYSRGKAIVLMDGDRQNDPADIGALLARLDQGFDCVSGWRQNRQDSGWRKIPSQIANRLVRKATRVPVHDLGCTLKAYTRRALDPTELYGEMHRFLAVYVLGRGGKIDEMIVRHHPRTAGQSKYGLNRTARVLADLLLIRILHKYRTRPSHMFAKVAQHMFLGAAAFGVLWFLGLVWHWSLVAGQTLFLSGLILSVGAVLVLMTGLVCELVIRTRYVLTGQRPWALARTVNVDESLSMPPEAVRTPP
jgi:dolichol-phosphate mannosyltransferase